MVICSNCGVELEDGLAICPLCGKNATKSEAVDTGFQNTPSDVLAQYRKENRRNLWELSGIIAFSGIGACTAIDLLAGKGLSWSLYTGLSITCVWIFITLILHLNSRPMLMIPGIMLDVLTLLAGLDLLTSGKQWFLTIGLPVTLIVFASIGALTILYKRAGLNGLNLLGAGFLCAALTCMVIEISLDLHTAGTVILRWSLYTAVSVTPVSLILFYYHYRLRKGNRLDSLFHI